MKAVCLVLLLVFTSTFAWANGVPPGPDPRRGEGGSTARGEAAPPSEGGTRVALELVLAVDVSTSVSAEEFALQRIGLFRAFRDPAVRTSVMSHPTGIAVSVVHWAGNGRQRVAVDWTHLTDEASLDRFSRKLGAMRRLTGGFTDIAGAVRFSRESLLQNAFRGDRLVIDVSGDGIADQGSPPTARDEALADGIVINGLAILPASASSGEALLAHYRFDVTGGPGSFVIAASSFEDFSRAMREKLIREISGPAFAREPAPSNGAAVAVRSPVPSTGTGGAL